MRIFQSQWKLWFSNFRNYKPLYMRFNLAASGVIARVFTYIYEKLEIKWDTDVSANRGLFGTSKTEAHKKSNLRKATGTTFFSALHRPTFPTRIWILSHQSNLACRYLISLMWSTWNPEIFQIAQQVNGTSHHRESPQSLNPIHTLYWSDVEKFALTLLVIAAWISSLHGFWSHIL